MKVVKYFYETINNSQKFKKILKIKINNSAFSAIITTKGAELISFKKNNSTEYIWEGNPNFWGKHSPVLFPIVGTLKNDSYTYKNKTYHLSRHGFARDKEFIVISSSENQAIFSLKSDDETKKVYPFDFEFQMIYTLVENNLNIHYKIKNNSDGQLPFSIGAHPAFALPEKFTNYSLEFEHFENLISHQLEDGLISNKTIEIPQNEKSISLDYPLFENDALIFKTLKSKSVTILENKNPLLKVKFNDFKSLGLWTVKNAPFICIEPWLGYSDTLKATGNILEKEAIQILEANQTFDCSFDIEIL